MQARSICCLRGKFLPMKDFSSPQVVCRPALPSDRADVLEFTKLIWEGHDYIRFVWDDWLADPRGLPAVAEYAGHAVALGKATHIAEHQWWLEGLRVDPKFQGRKISSHMFEYLDDWWQQHGVGECRLMTSSERVQVHHLCARLGWEKIGEVRAYKASPLATRAGEGHRFRGVDSAEIADAVEFASINLDYCAGLVDLGWQFAVPDQAILEEEREEGYGGGRAAGCWHIGRRMTTGNERWGLPMRPASRNRSAGCSWMRGGWQASLITRQSSGTRR